MIDFHRYRGYHTLRQGNSPALVQTFLFIEEKLDQNREWPQIDP